MRDVLTIIITSIIILVLWVFVGGREITRTGPKEIPQETLEISTPIDGRIDVEFLKEIN